MFTVANINKDVCKFTNKLIVVDISQFEKMKDFYDLYKLDYPWPRWVELSLNLELLVNRVIKFLLGQRLFNNNILCTTWIIPYPRNNHATE